MTFVATYEIGTTTTATDPATADAAETGDITQIADHCDSGLAVLISQFRNKPRIEGFLCALLDSFNAAETATIDLLTKVLSIDQAEGAQLDIIGSIVTEPRNGRLDSDYRRYLRVRLAVNLSKGTYAELINVGSLFTGVSSGWTIVLDGDGTFILFQPTAITDAVGLQSRLEQAAPAGVRLVLQYVPSGTAFRFSTSGEEATTSYGFGWPDNSSGGNFIHGLG